jgi:hypothetical protein
LATRVYRLIFLSEARLGRSSHHGCCMRRFRSSRDPLSAIDPSILPLAVSSESAADSLLFVAMGTAANSDPVQALTPSVIATRGHNPRGSNLGPLSARWSRLLRRPTRSAQCTNSLDALRGCNPIAKSGGLLLISVIPAKAGTQAVQSLAPCSCQGQALGPRFRGDDELSPAYRDSSKAGSYGRNGSRRAPGWREIVEAM